MRALVVDDCQITRRILQGILRKLGFEVSEAEHAAEAAVRLRELGRVDLLLVDWRMPGMSGIEFVSALRRDRDFDPMRIMMVTGETEVDQVAQALESGADEYLMKPFKMQDIAQKLEILGIAP